MLEMDTIEQAASRIGPYIRTTPYIRIEADTFSAGSELTLKLELMQHTGSFKPRGAFNRLLGAKVPPAGVVAASGGNHGIAVAYAAQQLGLRAEVFVPEIASRSKMQRLSDYQAEVIVTGANYAQALAASQKRIDQTGALPVHAYDQLEVVAGQGTLGREIEIQLEHIDTIVVAVGGGGLIGGITAWFRDRVNIIAVEPERACALATALNSDNPGPVDVEVSGIAADSLGARRVGDIMFPLASQYVNQVITVSDDDIRAAQHRLWQETRIAAEPGGATALAAITAGYYRPQPGENVVIVICGGNTDAVSL